MTELTAITGGAMAMWADQEQVKEIRELFAPKLTDKEFQFFMGIGKASKLNPFRRELWAIKYDTKSPAQVFVGRDGYRKIAQAHPEYDFHQADAVYANDTFKVVNGEVQHEYTMTNRGDLIGAYCLAKRHKSSRPMYVFVELKEYSTGRSVWKDKPATMIKKVAEAQCLRAAFQDVLGGTYDESEEYSIKKETKKPVEVVINPEDEQVLMATKEQIEAIENLIHERGFAIERLNKALEYYKASSIENLTADAAKHFIRQLNKEPISNG